ncbi:aspartate aminotransferase family protein [Xanthobacter pseudotagetidis]|uniref:aspartate aminotransferase family protein n=1 Tax=Xanthobacter pseudotagetidis TaxID=3119911 RepID=UPI00372B8724
MSVLQNDQGQSIDELKNYLVVNQNIMPAIEKGSGAEVIDEDGKSFIDLEAGPGVSSVGHAHPDIVAAIRDQLDRIVHIPGRYHSRRTLELAKDICEYAGNGMKRVFFANSGAESADGAIKIGLKHAVNRGKKGFGILAIQHGFHGRTSLPLALTGIAKQKRGMGPYGTFPGITHVPAPYCYRCPLKLNAATCGVKCAEAVETAIQTSVAGEPAIMIGEPVLGVGGAIVPPTEYWPKVEEILKRYDVTLIHDEVFTGFGRTGKPFAFHHFGTSPDVVTFAKAIGGGVPLGGFIATEELGTAFEPADHFTTYGAKNMLGMASGQAVMNVLRKENLAERAKAAGAQFLEGLRAFKKKFPILGDARGLGLMIGMEIVADDNRTPAPKLAKQLEAEALKNGVLISTTGVFGNTLRVTPPLVITPQQVDQALDRLGRALATVNESHAPG